MHTLEGFDLKDLTDIEMIYQYFFNENSHITISKIKSIITSKDFACRVNDDKSKLNGLFVPEKRVPASVLKRQFALFVDLVNSSEDIDKVFPEFSQYIKNVLDSDILEFSNEELKVLLSAISKINSNQHITEVDNFKGDIALLYQQNIDRMDNQRLGILIKFIKDKHYKDLEPEMQEFVVQLFNRCSVKAETGSNNKNIFSTRDWFGSNAGVYYEQFNKAFLGQGYNERPLLDSPTKKIAFKNLVDYANLQNVFIEGVVGQLCRSDATPAEFLNRKAPLFVYKYANDCVRELEIPKFPKEEGVSDFYLKESREYKKSIMPKMSNLFTEMIGCELDGLLMYDNVYVQYENLSDMFAKTLKQHSQLENIVLKHCKTNDCEEFINDAGLWLVGLVNLDKVAEIGKAPREESSEREPQEEFLEIDDFGSDVDEDYLENLIKSNPYMNAQKKNQEDYKRQKAVKSQNNRVDNGQTFGSAKNNVKERETSGYNIIEDKGMEQYSFFEPER